MSSAVGECEGGEKWGKGECRGMRLTFPTCQSKPSQWGCAAYGEQLQLFFVFLFVCFFPLPSIHSFIPLHIWTHFLLAWLVCLFSISPCAQAALDFQKPLCSGFCGFNYGNYFGKMQLFFFFLLLAAPFDALSHSLLYVEGVNRWLACRCKNCFVFTTSWQKAKPKGFKAVMPLGGVSTQPLIAVSEWLK